MKTEKSIICPTCGTFNDTNKERCQTCQRLLIQPLSLVPSDKSKILCHQCNAINDRTVKSCKQCGTRLQEKNNPTYLPFNREQRKHLPWYTWIMIFIALIIVLSTVFIFSVYNTRINVLYQFSLPNSIGILPVSSGQQIGINDGSFPPFDVGRPDTLYKQQAYQALKARKSQEALMAWNSALNIESNDAEALIYKENLYVLHSSKSYISIVAAMTFSAPFPDQHNEEILQGIYVAQHEFNQTHPLQIRILIANTSSLQYTTLVAQQIVSIAQQQKIVGVIGWPSSSSTITALNILTNAHIPLISSSTTSDALTSIASNFFRVVPPDSAQANLAADFALKELHASRAVVFVDRTNPYSQNIATDFERSFTQRGGNPVREEVFSAGETDFVALINDGLQYKPDVFYFTSPLSSDTTKFENDLPSSGPYSKLSVIEGDANHQIQRSSYGRTFFTSLAFPDAWAILNSKQNNPFFSEFVTAFDPNKLRDPGTYGYERPSAQAILAYDAIKVLQLALQQSSTARIPTAQDVLSNLPKITGANAYQGVSGQISFGPNHDPINKAVLMLSVNSEGFIELVTTSGCYIKGRCG